MDDRLTCGASIDNPAMPKPRTFTLQQKLARSARAIAWNKAHRALHVARTLAARAKRK